MKRIVNFSTKPLDAFAGLAMNASKPSTQRVKKENKINPKNGKPLTWQQYLRKHVLHSKSETLKKNPWLKETGYNIRDDAQKRLITAFDTNVAKVKKGIKMFQVALSIEEEVHV